MVRLWPVNALVPDIDPLAAGGLTGFDRNLLMSLALAAVGALVLSRATGVPSWRVAPWVFAITVPLAYTWTVAPGSGTPGCHWGMPPWEFRLDRQSYEILYNVILMVPAGAAAWLWPDGPRRLAALACAMCVPVGVEAVQRLLPELNRACQAGDLMNNMLGVFLGWSLVAGLSALIRQMRTPASGPASPLT